MRGRTNIPPRKAPEINGELKNFVVASGNTIAKGDFVSYVINGEYVNFDSRQLTLKYKCEYNEVDHKSVLVFDVAGANPLVMLVQVKDGDLVVLDSKSVGMTNVLVGVTVDGMKLYVADAPATITNTNANLIVNVFDIDNVEDTITLSQQVTMSINSGSSSNTMYISGIGIRSTTLFLCYVDYYAPTSGNKYLYYKVRLGTLGGSMSSTIVTLDTVQVSSSTNTNECYVYGIAGNVVITASLSAGNHNKTIVTTFSTSAQLDSETFDAKLLVSDKFGLKLCVFTTGTSSTNYIRFITIDIDGNISIDFGENTNPVNSKGYVFLGRTGASKYVVMTYYNSSPVRIVTKEYTIAGTVTSVTYEDNVVMLPNTTSVQCILSDYTTNVVLEVTPTGGNRGTVKYYGTSTENGFVLGRPSNTVKSYDGGYTVGFANTSGTAGQTIQVYTPYDS